MPPTLLTFFTVADNPTHEVFVIPFIASSLITNPWSVAEVLVNDEESFRKTYNASVQTLDDQFSGRYLIRSIPELPDDALFRSQPCYGAFLRFLISPYYRLSPSIPYTYITDIDMLFLEPILPTHVALMRETGLPYTNVLRPGTSRLTGCMMVENTRYYPAMDKAVREYLRDPKPLYWPIHNDEELLFFLVREAGLPLPTQTEQRFRPIMAIHTSVHRKIFTSEGKNGKPIPGWGCSEDNLRKAEELFDSPEWRELSLPERYVSEYVGPIREAIEKIKGENGQ